MLFDEFVESELTQGGLYRNSNTDKKSIWNTEETSKLCQEFLTAYLGVPGDLFDRFEMVDHYERARRGVGQRS
jgi:hypothetical protein